MVLINTREGAYAQRVLTYQQFVEKLKRSGLAIANEETCRAVLESVGYFPVINGYQVLSATLASNLSRGRYI